MFFREKSEIDQWCITNNRKPGAMLTLENVLKLAELWYGDRMSPDFRGRTADSARQIFGKLGLTDKFWTF